MPLPFSTTIGNREFVWGRRTYIMGILNMSPESFSEDGLTGTEAALAQAARLMAEGADILDIGGESTKPGALPIPEDEEIRRIIPVVQRLSREINLPISVDTSKYAVAQLAIEAGAVMLNDQWGLKREPRLAELAAARGLPILLMSNQRDRGSYDPSLGRDSAPYPDVMAEVLSNLRWSLQKARQAGVPDNHILLDPGIGFGKTWQQEIEIVRRLRELTALGQPLLIGPSRKSLIKMVLNLPVHERVEGTIAVAVLSLAHGADIIRVHDVQQVARACRMADAIVKG